MKKIFCVLALICVALYGWADNKIYYTSKSGKVVEPYVKSGFGANIVSNTYVNGQGVITFDGEVTSIGGEEAFLNCTDLASIKIPESVTSLGLSAFSGCTGLTSVTLPKALKSIGGEVFSDCTGLKSITIPELVARVEDCAFYACTGLTSVTMTDAVTSIGWAAFEGCTGLKTVTLPKCLKTIDADAFNKCTGLTSITIPNTVKSIGEEAFEDCTGLKSVILSDSLENIGEMAFNNCTNITSVEYMTIAPFAIKSDIFSCYETATLTVQPVFVATFKKLDGWKNFATIAGRKNYDVNEDGTVNATDVVSIYNYIINGN